MGRNRGRKNSNKKRKKGRDWKSIIEEYGEE